MKRKAYDYIIKIYDYDSKDTAHEHRNKMIELGYIVTDEYTNEYLRTGYNYTIEYRKMR